MRIFPLLRTNHLRALELLGINSEEDVISDTHLYYYLRKIAMKSLYRQLRSKGLSMNDALCNLSRHFSLSIDRVRDILFR